MATDYSGNQNQATTPASGTPVGGDLAGSSALATVTQIQGKSVPLPTVTENGKVLQYNSGTGAYVWVSPTAGSGGTSAVDKSAFSEGVDSFNPVGGIYDETLGSDPADKSNVFLRLTVKRAAHVNLRTAAGVETGTSGSPLRVDPTGTTTQPVSAASLPLPAGAATETTLGAVLKEGTDITGAAMPAGGASGRGWLSAIWSAITTRLPAALAGGRLDVNVGKAPGTVSTANSSTATLLANGVFTGASEDVSGYALIEVTVFADQASAAGGLSLQFSSNGTNWDFTQAVTVSASAGAAYAVSPVGQFFRLVYTNGAVNQTAFRLQTVYRPVGSLPTLATFQDVNAALAPPALMQRVAADLMIQDAADNLTERVRCAKDLVSGVGGATLLGQASGIYQAADAKFYPWAGTQAGGGFVQQSGVWTVQPGNTANTTAWKVDNSGVTQPVSGSVSVSNFPATQPVSGTVAVTNQDILTSALRDAITGAGAAAKSLADVVTAVNAQTGTAMPINTVNGQSRLTVDDPRLRQELREIRLVLQALLAATRARE